MSRRFNLQYSLLEILMNAYKGQENEGDKRLKFVARHSMMKNIFAEMFSTLVRDKILPNFNEMPRDIQNEYWGIAEEINPGIDVEDQYRFIHAMLAIAWMLSNPQ